MQIIKPDTNVDLSIAANDHGIDALAAKLSTYLKPEHIAKVRDAFALADEAHAGQKRRSGEAYVSHPVAVADILATIGMDYQTVMAAILHDVIEDTEFSKEDLTQRFGAEVAELVDGVSKLTQIKFESRVVQQAENFQKMAMAMAKDVRVILIKLADRLHNVRTLGALPAEKKHRIAKETLDIYAPIAMRLGMNDFRVEFEDRCLEAIYPMRVRRIKAALKTTEQEREVTLQKICSKLEKHFKQLNFSVEIKGRQKHLYSIYQKMKKQRKSLHDILDVYACRIIVDDVDSCYRALGIVHNLFKPVTQTFKDYISIPKANGYQSLHTVVFGERVPIEVQIRSREMEGLANRGIAAHWVYKGNPDPNEDFTAAHLRARRWLSGLQEMRDQSGDSLEFIEHFKTDLFSDEVYVFTPKGDILELPDGSTAIDFAYAVHTDVGNTCVACEVNRAPASLSEPLQSGQTVKIKTDPAGQPSEQWLKFVVTGKARSNIRHHLKRKRYQESLSLGERLLNKALTSLHFPEVSALSNAQISQLLSETDYEKLEYLIEDIGLGNRPAYLTAKILLTEKPKRTGFFAKKPKKKKQALTITGTEGMLLNYSACCYPIPGDQISGVATGGNGIDVHMQDCLMLKSAIKAGKHAEHLHWSEEIDRLFSVVLKVEMSMHRGFVAYLAKALDQTGAYIQGVQAFEQTSNLTSVLLEIDVKDRVHLARVIKVLKNNKAILSVARNKFN